MTRLKNEVLAILGYLFDKLLSSKVLISIRNWHRRYKKEIQKDILIALVSALIVVVVLNGMTHKRMDELEEIRERAIAAEIAATPEPVWTPEPIPTPLTDPYKMEAEEVARVLYGTARTNSEADQRAVVWCIINRCESSLYPNSIEEVCRQPVQWMGYSEENPIVQDLYDIANEELTTWHNGGYRMVAPEFLFLSWSQNEIVLRTSFTENASCRYWKAK